MLLRSRPDMVHGFLLRKTQISTPVCPGSDYMQCPKQNIPCYSGFQVQGAATSPAAWKCINNINLYRYEHGIIQYTHFPKICQEI